MKLVRSGVLFSSRSLDHVSNVESKSHGFYKSGSISELCMQNEMPYISSVSLGRDGQAIISSA